MPLEGSITFSSATPFPIFPCLRTNYPHTCFPSPRLFKQLIHPCSVLSLVLLLLTFLSIYPCFLWFWFWTVSLFFYCFLPALTFACFVDCSFALPLPFCFAGVWPCLFLTMLFIKAAFGSHLCCLIHCYKRLCHTQIQQLNRRLDQHGSSRENVVPQAGL